MKKIFGAVFLFAIAGVFQLACAQKSSQSFFIKGDISGKAEGKMVYLKTADKKKVLDSTIIKNGKFQFTGNVAYPQLYNIVIAKNDTPRRKGMPVYQPVIPLFAENTTINISAVLENIPAEDYSYTGAYNYKDVQISGSRSNDTYLGFLKGYEPLAKKRSDIFMDEYIAYLNPGKDKQKGPFSEGVKIVSKIDDAAKSRDEYVKSFVKEHPSDVVSVYIAKDKLPAFSVTEIDEILASLSSKVMDTEAGRNLRERAIEVKKTAAGAQYADFSFMDNKGNPVKLSDHLGKGKYVLLEFWASWCGPCRADIPHLKENYEMYNPEGFEVISVSMDDDKAKWLKAIEEEKMSWLQVSDLKAFSGELSKLYNFNGIPTCLLIDPKGKIVTRNMRGSWMDKKLIELYGNKFAADFRPK